MPERLQSLRYLLFPLLALGCLVVYLPQLPVFSSPWEELLPSLPFVLGALIGLLGWHFNSARSLLACLLILLTDLSFYPALDPLYHQVLVVLLPLNLAQIAWYRERGLFNPIAFARFFWIAIQLCATVAAVHYQSDLLTRWLQFHPGSLPRLPLPLVTLAALALATLIIMIRLLRHRGRFDAYLLISCAVTCGLLLQPVSSRDVSLILSLLLALWLFGLLRHGHSLAYIDDLTGLPGRRALNERLMRLGRQYCLAMVDVDHFKKFNDRHGHDTGDQVLKMVATKLARVRLGKAYRYGGEEFCVVFSGRALAQTLEPLEELRAAIEQSYLQLRHVQRPGNNKQGRKQRGGENSKRPGVSVTISIGVAEYQPRTDTLKAADQALYTAKAAGRNQVCY